PLPGGPWMDRSPFGNRFCFVSLCTTGRGTMQPNWHASAPRYTLWSLGSRLAILLVPAALLTLGAWFSSGEVRNLLALGAVFQLLVCLLNILSRTLMTQPLGPSVIMLYIIGLAWVLLAGSVQLSWYSHLAQAVFLVVPLCFFALQTLSD